MKKYSKRRRPAPSTRALTMAGWIFLGLAIVAAVIVILLLARHEEPELPHWEPTYPSNETIAAPEGGGLSGAEGGVSVIIDRLMIRVNSTDEPIDVILAEAQQQVDSLLGY